MEPIALHHFRKALRTTSLNCSAICFSAKAKSENVFGPAVGTRMSLRITIKEDYIKFLCALVAIDRFFYGENPFHLGVTDLINLEHCFWPRRPLRRVSSLQQQVILWPVIGASSRLLFRLLNTRDSPCTSLSWPARTTSKTTGALQQGPN